MGKTVVFGCKDCGSPHVREKDGKLHCISCGAWFEKNVETDEERDARVLYLTRLDRAEELLRMSPPRFDDAEDHFREFIKEYPDHSDGYWGLVRARYGIKYEDDTKGKSVPSCYKSSYRDFRRDSDFLMALSCAENDSIYDNLQKKAKLIADVCKEWREEAKKDSYDIFISFKAPDKESGISDEDQKEMEHLYTHLLGEGYRVFFSPYSMRKHSGKHYDSYIFNALQSARVQIVYGSKPEYFTSTWVQNEWTRFLRMTANGEKKKGSCIVVYNGFNPNMLPHDLRKLQAIDASKNNRMFYHDLLDVIKKVLADGKSPDANAAMLNGRDEILKELSELETRLSGKPIANEQKKEEPKKVQPKIDPSFEVVDGCLVNYKGNQSDVVIPEGVTSIGKSAFSGSRILISIVIGDSVTSIGESAFEGCLCLTNVVIGNGVASIGESAFDGCSSLSNITIGNKVETIGNRAFAGCTKLVSIIIPNSVVAIGRSAFSRCTNLESISIPFVGSSKNGIINTHLGYIFGASDHKDHYSDYTTHAKWYIPASLLSVTITGSSKIDSYAFYCCGRISSIIIGDEVTFIGDYAFDGCNLRKAVIGKAVSYIGDHAFSWGNYPSVTFRDPKGWYIEGKRTPFLFLNNDSIATKYLTDKYKNCKWIKKK